MAKRDANGSGSCSKGRNDKRRRTVISKGELKLRTLSSFFKKELKQDVLNSLKDIERDVKLNKPIRWSKLLPVLRATRVNDETAPYCLKFVKELLRLFERYNCKDARVIPKVFSVLVNLTGFYVRCMDQPPNFRKFFCIPYGKAENIIDLLWYAVKTANLGLLKLLLRFGIGMTTLHFSSFEAPLQTYIYDWPLNSGDVTSDERTIGDEISREYARWSIEERKAIEERFRSNFNCESMKRLGLVLRTLDTVMQMKRWGPDYKDHFIECYGLLFESVPEPYVSSVEVAASLEKCIPVSCHRLISTITEDYKSTLPELTEVLQPRSLKHLCRIQARQCLRQNLNLPSGVSSLPLPAYLKQYITLNDDEDYSVIIKTDMVADQNKYATWIMPISYINIPEKDDCVTSFLRKLTDGC